MKTIQNLRVQGLSISELDCQSLALYETTNPCKLLDLGQEVLHYLRMIMLEVAVEFYSNEALSTNYCNIL